MNSEITPPSDVAIITVSYNSSAQLSDFLTHATTTVSDSNQIFVMDNASADIQHTRSICDKFGVHIISLEENKGYGGAINAALDHIPDNVSHLLICNPDVELNLAAVDSLLKVIATSEKIGTAGPRILNTDGSIYPSAREIPSIATGIGHALFANIWPSNPWTARYHSVVHLSGETIPTGWVSGACIAIKREIFHNLGGFDGGYFMYFEDVDLGYRLFKAGYTNVYVPSAVVTHIGGESTKSVKSTMLRIHHESALRFIRKKYPGVLNAPLRAIVQIGLAVRLWIQLNKLKNQPQSS